MDVLLSGAALVVLSPIMAVTALLIRMEDRGPAIFRQQRVGQGGRPFQVMKFRSMPVNTPNVPSASAKALTVTRVGKIIRRTNIDELPQLITIFRGDMSIVGPRPALFTQESLLEMRKANGALDAKPGLTGLAQVHSYDNMPEEEKARWDGEYARNISFLGDLSIIFRTFGYLARRPPSY
jgi:O-antigen biosynthesis protein WbqP